MGIAERKERERTELKARIMGAARQLFLDKGYENTSMRNIASLIEYSPGTIYHYFKDKGEIFHALHAEGFTDLGKRMILLKTVSNSMERLKAMGKVYIEFGIEIEWRCKEAETGVERSDSAVGRPDFTRYYRMIALPRGWPWL